MNHDPHLSELAADEGPAPPRPPWLLLVMMGVGGFALGLLIATAISTTGPGDVTPTLPPAAVPTSTSSSTSSEIEDVLPSLEKLVPGFEGTLYFTDPESLDTNDHYLVTWSSNGSTPVATQVRADYLQLDVTGSWMAVASGPTLGTLFPGSTMRIFRFLDNSRPFPLDPDGYVGSAVAGIVWHASRPGLLAWIEIDNSYRSTVKVANLSNPNALVQSGIEGEFDYAAWPRYWDNDLFVISTQSQSLSTIDGQPIAVQYEVQTFDSEWELLGTTPGEFVGRLPTGELVITVWDPETQQPRDTFVMDSTLAERLTPDWLPEGTRLTSVLPTADGTGVWLFGAGEDGTFLVRLDDQIPSQCDYVVPVSEAAHGSPDGDWIVLQSVEEAEEASLWFINAATCRTTHVDLPDGVGYLAAVGR